MPTRFWPLFAIVLVACGGRSDIDLLGPPSSPVSPEAGVPNAPLVPDVDGGPEESSVELEASTELPVEAGLEASLVDGPEVFDLDASEGEGGDASDVIEPSPATEDGGVCSEGLNTEYAPEDGGGETLDWFASPYTPSVDITVTSLGVHNNGGGVAILAASGDMPGTPLFQTRVPANPADAAKWHAVAVDPPVSLTGGQLYFLAEWDNGVPSLSWPPVTCPIEYDSPSPNGPWTVTGTDCWVIRVTGTCP